MNSPNSLKSNDDVLEMISDAENVIILDSEHEEGEISSDDSDEDGEISSLSLPPSPSTQRHTHPYTDCFSPSPNRSPSVTSEVVIYDDHGRTAIFTSPRKKSGLLNLGGYTVVTEASKSWRDEVRERGGVSRREREEASSWRERETGSNRRDKEGIRERERGGNSSKHKEEDRDRRKWHGSYADTKTRGKADVCKRVPEKRKKGDKTKGSSHSQCRQCKKVSSSDSSSETSSHSCSSSSDESEEHSPSVTRSKGKENKSCLSVSKAGDKSHPQQDYCLKRPPPKSVIRLPLLHKTPSSKSRSTQKKIPATSPKSTCRKYAEKSSPKKLTQNSKDSNLRKSDSKPVQSSWKEVDIPLLKGQKKPPPGSLGEMLLKKKIIELKLQSKREGLGANATEGDTKVVKTSDNNMRKLEKLPPGMEPECYTLDQEDEDELQLRLVALQSSLRFLSDIRKEGQKEGPLKLSTSGDNSAIVLNEKALSFINQSSQLQDPEYGSFSAKSEDSSLMLKDVLPAVTVGTSPSDTVEALHKHIELKLPTNCLLDSRELSLKAEQALILDELNGSSSKPVSLSSSPDHEPYPYSCSSTDPTKIGERLKQVQMKNEELKGVLKEQQDSNQDPVDMDICNSSGEEEEGELEVEELVQEVGESFRLDTPDSPAHINSVFHNHVSDISSIVKEGGSGIPDSAPNTLQIPVEWAYMMPPPPPPDQPANDLDNIDNWCYDQNMYLQTMQVSFDANSQYSQYGMEDMSSEDWRPQQEQVNQNPPWCSPNRDSYEQMEGPSLSSPQPPILQSSNQLDSGHLEGTDVFHQLPELETDLKNTPAEQYQAFMSVVLNRQSPPPKKSHSNDRTLIQVPIIKNGNKQTNPQKKVEARRRKRERQKHRLRQLKGAVNQKALVQSMDETQEISPKSVHSDDSSTIQPGSEPSTAQSSNSGADEEDEDVLRAQLLIDMSRRKQQKEEKSLINQQVPVAGVSYMASKKTSGLKSTVTREEAGSSSSYLVKYSELLSISKPRTARSLLQKNITNRSRSLESSPSHVFKGEGRTGLSDIGGFALDPKSSQFYYQNPLESSSVDSEKIKFPPIKPVVINLNSDSEEEESSSQKCLLDSRKEAEPEPSSGGAFDQSLDLLLKSLRNTKPAKKDIKVQEKPVVKEQHSDSTPHVVRHLSKRQQVEYRMLKEELRKKEILQKRKMQQKKPGTTFGLTVKPTSSHNNTSTGENVGITDMFPVDSGSQDLQDKGKPGREVSLKEMGRLKIQLSNIASTFDKHSAATAGKRQRTAEEKPLQVDSREDASLVGSADVSNAEEEEEEEEDEETLRMMVLHTLKKNTSEKKGNDIKQRKVMVESDCVDEISPILEGQSMEVDKHPHSLKVVIHQTTSSSQNAPEDDSCQDPQQNSIFREVVITDGRKTEDNESDQNDNPPDIDEKFAGEWMVLDQVQDEDSDCSIMEGSLEQASNLDVSENDSCLDSSVNDCDISKISENEINCEIKDLPDKEFEKSDACIIDMQSSASLHPEGASGADEEVSVKKDIVSRLGEAKKNHNTGDKTNSNSMKSSSINSVSGTSLSNSLLGCKTRLSKVPSKCIPKSAKLQKLSTCQVREEIQSEGGLKVNAILQVKEESGDKSMGTSSGVEQEQLPNKLEGINVRSQDGTLCKSTEDTDTANYSFKKEAITSKVSADSNQVIDAVVADNKTTIQAKEIQLKNVEKAYIAKRGGMNRVISQLDSLVQEATQEEQERQTLRKSVAQLRAQLADMEVQLETKGDALKTKMEKIRSLHKQILADRQTIGKLQKKGELLGRQVHGSNYILPKVLLSPDSKTKDTYVKKALASSIDALRRVRNTNSAVTPANTSNKIFRPLTSSFRESVKGLQNLQVYTSKPSVVVSKDSTSIKCTTQAELSNYRSCDQINNITLLKTRSRTGVAGVKAAGKVVKRKIEAQDSPVNMKSARLQDKVQSNKQHTCSPQGNYMPKDDGLDEMSELCPHDLLGRCNDDACIYQHIAHHPTTQTRTLVQVSPGSVRTPAQIVASGSASKTKPIAALGSVSKADALANLGSVTIAKSIATLGSVSNPRPVTSASPVSSLKLVSTSASDSSPSSVATLSSVTSPKLATPISFSNPVPVTTSVVVSNTKPLASSFSVCSPKTVATKGIGKMGSVTKTKSTGRGRGVQMVKNTVRISGGDSVRVGTNEGESSSSVGNYLAEPVVSCKSIEIETDTTKHSSKVDESQVTNVSSPKASLFEPTSREIESDCDHSSNSNENRHRPCDAEAESIDAPLPVNQQHTQGECNKIEKTENTEKDGAEQEQDKMTNVTAQGQGDLTADGVVSDDSTIVKPLVDTALEENYKKTEEGLDSTSDKREISSRDMHVSHTVDGAEAPSERLFENNCEQQMLSIQSRSCSRDTDVYLPEQMKVDEEIITQVTQELEKDEVSASDDAEKQSCVNICVKRSSRLKAQSVVNVEDSPVTASTGVVTVAETRSSKRKRSMCSTNGLAVSNQDKGTKTKVVARTLPGRRGRHRGRRKK